MYTCMSYHTVKIHCQTTQEWWKASILTR